MISLEFQESSKNETEGNRQNSMYVDSERVQNGDTKKLELDSNSTNTDLEICRMDSNEDSTNSQISKKINKIPKTVSSTPQFKLRMIVFIILGVTLFTVVVIFNYSAAQQQGGKESNQQKQATQKQIFSDQLAVKKIQQGAIAKQSQVKQIQSPGKANQIRPGQVKQPDQGSIKGQQFQQQIWWQTPNNEQVDPQQAETYSNPYAWLRSEPFQQLDEGSDKLVQNYLQTRIMDVFTNSPEPQNFNDVNKITNQKQLPFCIPIVSTSDQKIRTIQQSIQNQLYTNYIYFSINSMLQPVSYQLFKSKIESYCPKNSLIMIIKDAINEQTLVSLNYIHQKQNVWAIYQRTSKYLQILSFYTRIFELIQLNDFNYTNSKYLQAGSPQILAISILQLCQLHLKQVKHMQMGVQSSYIGIRNKNEQIYERDVYSRLFKLSQDYQVDINSQQQLYSKIKNLKQQSHNRMSGLKMMNAIHRLQLMYLPENHSLNQLQYMEYNEKNGISKYTSIESQVLFCVTVLNHNNIQNNRYRKLLFSILQQKYDNYHIVFIDDSSDDNSLYMFKQLTQKHQFPQARIKFVKNLKRMFATYNIINAAFNFCKPDDVQLLLDGDDQLIGKYAFQIINAHYQYYPSKWLIISNYKSSIFNFGSSQNANQRMLHQNGKRTSFHFMGPIRTWRVKLICSIPIQYHTDARRNWFTTDYDDALQYPLVQLSGTPRVLYIPQILYEYNVNYGDNDNSTQQKRKMRKKVYQYILSLKPLKILKNLQQAVKNTEIQTILQKDKDINYQIVQ